MPTDGITLGFLARECSDKLTGGRVEKILQPDKSTIILVIHTKNGGHRLLISASADAPRVQTTEANPKNPKEAPMFCMLMRKRLTGARLASIRQIGGDRVMWIDFDTEDELGEPATLRLIAECAGRNANIILVDSSMRVIDSSRRVTSAMSRVREILPGRIYSPPPPQDKLDPSAITPEQIRERLPHEGSLAKAIMGTITGAGPVVADEIAYRVANTRDPKIDESNRNAIVEKLHAFLSNLRSVSSPCVVLDERNMPRDAFPFVPLLYASSQIEKRDSLSAAMDDCHIKRDEARRNEHRVLQTSKQITSLIERERKKLAIYDDAIDKEDEIEHTRLMGEIITANIYRIHKGDTILRATDYSKDDAPEIDIQLDAQLSPQLNAKRFFNKSKKMKAARDNALELREASLKSIALLETLLSDLEGVTDELEYAEVRAALVEAGFAKREQSRGKPRKQQPSSPYIYESQDGVQIVVGKTSAQNERVTRDAQGEYTWLHVKDMPGSHVIIRDTNAPTDATLRDALALAAWYCKGRMSTAVPIDVTLRKHVRKPPASPPGFVTYTHQETYMVEPSEKAVAGIKRIK